MFMAHANGSAERWQLVAANPANDVSMDNERFGAAGLRTPSYRPPMAMEVP